MTRAVVGLAIRTGIAPDVWLRQPTGYIETAIDLLAADGGGARTRESEFDIDMSE